MATFSCLNDTSMEINFQLLKKKKEENLKFTFTNKTRVTTSKCSL